MRSALPLLLTALAAGSVAGQAPIVIPPVGTLMIELGGDFSPALDEMVDGRRRKIGSALTIPSLDAGNFPLMADLQNRLRAVTGAGGGGSLGSLDAIGEFQRGVGTIGLSAGVKPWLAVWAKVPIVSARTQMKLALDPAGSTTGLNPALAGAGSAAFFAQFDAAIEALDAAIESGAYQGDPALHELANATAARAPGLRGSLYDLLANPASLSPVLPVADSPEGEALLDVVSELQQTLSDRLGIPGFASSPSLPATPLSQEQFDALLIDPAGFGLRPFDDPPLVGLGDISLGATALLFRRSGGTGSSLAVWGSAGFTFATGTARREDALRDQGTGSGRQSVSAGLSADLVGGRFALRGAMQYSRPLAATRTMRVGGRDDHLIPFSRTLAMEFRDGAELTLAAQPFFRIVDRLALTGRASYWRRGEQRWTSVASLPEWWSGGDPARLGQGTGADAVTVGLGLAYSHDGNHRDGGGRMPVEAGLMVERTVASGTGIVPLPLTSRVYFRVYKRIFGG